MKNLPIVLVVEDDKAIVHLLSTILDANDYRVVQVSTAGKPFQRYPRTAPTWCCWISACPIWTAWT